MHTIKDLMKAFGVNDRRTLKSTIQAVGLPYREAYSEEEFELLVYARHLIVDENLNYSEVADRIAQQKAQAGLIQSSGPGQQGSSSVKASVAPTATPRIVQPHDLDEYAYNSFQDEMDMAVERAIPHLPTMFRNSVQKYLGQISATRDAAYAAVRAGGVGSLGSGGDSTIESEAQVVEE